MSKEKDKDETPELPDDDAPMWQDDDGYCDKGNDIILGERMP